jgi:hypothetical protein
MVIARGTSEQLQSLLEEICIRKAATEHQHTTLAYAKWTTFQESTLFYPSRTGYKSNIYRHTKQMRAEFNLTSQEKGSESC